jgi:YesN/AraC family two-component response regulator
VTINSQSCAFILQSETIEQVKQQIYASLSFLENTATSEGNTLTGCFIAISDFCTSITGLQNCYQQTKKILEYKNFFTNTNIVSFSQIESFETTIYSYSLALENQLIQNVIEGKNHALDIYDQIIKDNFEDKQLSCSSNQSLMFSLIGTLLRIFQELKSEPENLLGKPINYKELYDRWAEKTTVLKIRDIQKETIAAIHEKKTTSEQDLITRMKQYIYENYWDNIMLEDLAYNFNISPQYCGILFKDLSENNFKDFLNRYRINKAKEIIGEKPDIKTNDLFSLVGFTNANSFIRVFRKYSGFTPGAYGEMVSKGK